MMLVVLAQERQRTQEVGRVVGKADAIHEFTQFMQFGKHVRHPHTDRSVGQKLEGEKPGLEIEIDGRTKGKTHNTNK